MALPTEIVFEHGFDLLDGGIKFNSKAFEVLASGQRSCLWTRL